MEKRIKQELEFSVHSSPAILYSYLSGASGLAEWYADEVNVKGSKLYLFRWEGDDEPREAEMVKSHPKKNIVFKWTDRPEEHEEWGFEIFQDELTGDVTLVVTDYCEEDEEEINAEVWESQVELLKSLIGA